MKSKEDRFLLRCWIDHVVAKPNSAILTMISSLSLTAATFTHTGKHEPNQSSSIPSFTLKIVNRQDQVMTIIAQQATNVIGF